jgi:hypothetical protein
LLPTPQTEPGQRDHSQAPKITSSTSKIPEEKEKQKITETIG